MKGSIIIGLKILIFSVFLQVSCTSTSTSVPTTTFNKAAPNCSPATSVSRDEVIAIAETYRTWQWIPTTSNSFHGFDQKGIRVDTPDHQFKPDNGIRPGWWKPGQTNVGIPYKWGGFDSPQSFSEKIKSGKYAGDIYTQQKRQQLNDAVSDETCGVDCSGFVSRCWRLAQPYSTRTLPNICTALPSWDDLKKGDIVNKSNDHVLIFEHWLDESKTRFMAYETGCPPTWKVLRHPIQVNYVKGLGYLPYRYNNIH